MPVETKPPQTRPRKPAREQDMRPRPQAKPAYNVSLKLEGKVALITGGDNGIGRAIAVAFAHEGAQVAFVYLNEHKDAEQTREMVEQSGRQCLTLPGDIADEDFCKDAVAATVKRFGRLDILVNNAGEPSLSDFEKISRERLERTFRTNLFAMFSMTQAALRHIPPGGTIVNTASVTAYRGNPYLVDYSSTKGAIVAFTRSLSLALAERKIRVNAVAPGPIWTPHIPSTLPADRLAKFGADTPMRRPGEPAEVAPCYVFLASDDSSYMSGQVLHPNGGEIVNS
jgi:NAD(P)-dependent dehydrogenase (short-subunit alcohol dehydrogenase family)